VKLWQHVQFLLGLTRSHGILRRYFVVNGFDGALTMLGLILGFYLSDSTDVSVVIAACLGAAIALGVSGVSSAYISEVAERRLELAELEGAMVKDLSASAHGLAARWVPLLTAIVNGSSPFLVSLLILTPLWLAEAGMPLPPLLLAMATALFILFLLGVFLGRIAGVSWWRSGLQTLLIALVTAALILLTKGFAL
jgi:predicted membrane protein (TIGR00267 family)